MKRVDFSVPKAFRDIVQKRARFKAFYSGRGCGKSTAFAIAVLIKIMNSNRKVRVLCCREVQKTIKESVKHELDKWITELGLQEYFVSTASEITGPFGSQIMFHGMQKARAVAMQSLSDIDIVWVEEASTISQVSLNTLIPTIRKDGSEIWFAWNPRSPRDPVDAYFRGTDIATWPVPEKVRAFYDQWAIVQEVFTDSNPFFTEVMRAEMERDRERDPEKYKHVWCGEYAHRSDSAVFRNWRIGTMDVPAGAKPFYGADWGFSIDPSVLVRCFVFEDLRVLYIDAEASGVQVEIDRTPDLFDSIAPLNDPLHPRKWPLMADSSRPETISYMQKHGYPNIKRARKGPGSVEEGIEFIKRYDVLINPNCKRTIDEFTFYAYDRDPLTDEVLPELLDKDNHVIDAVRYAVEGIRRNSGVAVGGFGVVTKGREYFGDPSNETENPALSPARPGGARSVKGVIW